MPNILMTNTERPTLSLRDAIRPEGPIRRLSRPIVHVAAIFVLAGVTGCSPLWRPPVTADACTEAYRRGDYVTLAEAADRFDRLTPTCQRAVMVALAEDDPERLLEVVTDASEQDLLVAAALAVGVSGAQVDVPFRARRVLRRSADGRFLLAWLKTGDLETTRVGSTLGIKLTAARTDVARLLYQGADHAALRLAVRKLAVVTESAMHDGAVFGATLPRVPVRPKTTTLEGLAVKLSLVPYLINTSASAALTVIEMDPVGPRESESKILSADVTESTEG